MMRAFRPDDRDAFARVLQNQQTMAAWGGVYSPEQVDAELRHYLDHHERYGYAPFAVWLGDELVGDIGLQRLEDGPDVELLYRLLPSAWGRGLGTEACQAALAFAFSALRLPHVLAVIGEENLASQRLAEKLGFVRDEVGTYYGQRLVRYHLTQIPA